MAAALPAIYLCNMMDTANGAVSADIERVAPIKLYKKWLSRCACCSKAPDVAAYWSYWTPLCMKHLHYMIKEMYPIPVKTVLLSNYESPPNKANP